jgi:hypothetical protein
MLMAQLAFSNRESNSDDTGTMLLRIELIWHSMLNA